MDNWLPVLFAIGAAATIAAVVAWLGDRRRMRRRQPDAVGFMPWRDVFFWSLLIAVIALGLGGREWLMS